MPETPVFSAAAAAAPHALASETGRAILAEGGNAVEAVVAMAATIAVVYPHMNAIGGDAFWIIREPGGRVRAIEACGPAGRLATIERYRAKGYDAIPPRGPDAALTVAGAVGGWRAALDYAASIGGNLPLRLLLDEAIRHAREGYPVSRSEARYEPKEMEALRAAPGFTDFFFIDGKPPEAGAEAYRALPREPLSARLGKATAYNFPPPTQGLASLLILGIFERLGVTRGETVEHHHGLIEATKRANAIRDRVVTDFDRLTHEPSDFLTSAVFEREAAAIRMDRAAAFPVPAPAEGDTIWMGAIDRDGLAVSYIQSIYWEFGSGVVLPKTGVHWQNRGVSFSLDPRAKNPLQPGRKPFHTLNPPLAVFGDGRVLSYGCMGGEGQPQFQAQIFTRHAAFGMGLADAVDAPRWLLGRTWGASSTTLKLENRFDSSIVSGLRRLGHDVEELDVPYRDSLGHAGMLLKHPRDGRVEATHDPRSDGGAAGL